MGAALRLLIEFLGIKLIDSAISAIVKLKVDELLGEEENNGEIPDQNNQIAIDINTRLFNTSSVFRAYTDELVCLINNHMKNVHLSKSDILFSVRFTFKNSKYNELIYELLENKKLKVEVYNGKETVSYDNYAIDHIVEYCHNLFTTHLQNFAGNLEQQADHVGLPYRVVHCIDESFRPGSSSFGDRIVSIPPVEYHVIYDTQKNQKDIFGHDLIFGKIAIIKYKDDVSDVYTYGVVYPRPSCFDYSRNYSWFLTDASITSFVEKIAPIDNSDLLLKEIPFTFLDTMIKRLY